MEWSNRPDLLARPITDFFISILVKDMIQSNPSGDSDTLGLEPIRLIKSISPFLVERETLRKKLLR